MILSSLYFSSQFAQQIAKDRNTKTESSAKRGLTKI
jgi:hypothetical protein